MAKTNTKNAIAIEAFRRILNIARLSLCKEAAGSKDHDRDENGEYSEKDIARGIINIDKGDGEAKNKCASNRTPETIKSTNHAGGKSDNHQ